MDKFNKAQIKNQLEDNLSKIFGVQGSEASANELYKAYNKIAEIWVFRRNYA